MIVWDDSRDDLVRAISPAHPARERRVDELMIHDDEMLHCETCGHDYTLREGTESEEDKPD